MKPRTPALHRLWLISLLVAFFSACTPSGARQKVAVELHLMATCPFAREALTALFPVLDALGEHVALDVNYIGRIREGQPSALYGTAELMRAKQALCTLDLGGVSAWRRFEGCLLEGKAADACTESAGLTSASLGACTRGAKGDALLRASYERSEQAHMTASPTLRVAGKPYEFARSEPLMARALCSELDDLDYCRKLPAPTKVHITLITDRRCKGESCDGAAFLRFVSRNLPAASVRKLDYSEAEARELLSKGRQTTLPAAIFDTAIERERALYSRLAPLFTRLPEGAGHAFTIGQEWDPKRAI